MPRRNIILLSFILIILFGLSGWMIFHAISVSRNSFLTGAPPEDMLKMLIPQKIDLAKMHPPAVRPGDPFRFGNVTSSANVIVYGDFECPSCVQMNQMLNTIIPTYQGKVRLVWRDLPMTAIHSNAMKAAIFARCAGVQGQFWQAHDALFQYPQLSNLTYSDISSRLRLDSASMSQCQNNPKIQAAIEQDIKTSAADGVGEAPFLFIGTKAADGTITAEQLKGDIDLFLKS